MKWISVEDDLPAPYVDVFIYPRPEYMYTVFDGWIDTNGNWETGWEDSHQTYEERPVVTHWMPIPENPS